MSKIAISNLGNQQLDKSQCYVELEFLDDSMIVRCGKHDAQMNRLPATKQWFCPFSQLRFYDETIEQGIAEHKLQEMQKHQLDGAPADEMHVIATKPSNFITKAGEEWLRQHSVSIQPCQKATPCSLEIRGEYHNEYPACRYHDVLLSEDGRCLMSEHLFSGAEISRAIIDYRDRKWPKIQEPELYKPETKKDAAVDSCIYEDRGNSQAPHCSTHHMMLVDGKCGVTGEYVHNPNLAYCPCKSCLSKTQQHPQTTRLPNFMGIAGDQSKESKPMCCSDCGAVLAAGHTCQLTAGGPPKTDAAVMARMIVFAQDFMNMARQLNSIVSQYQRQQARRRLDIAVRNAIIDECIKEVDGALISITDKSYVKKLLSELKR